MTGPHPTDGRRTARTGSDASDAFLRDVREAACPPGQSGEDAEKSAGRAQDVQAQGAALRRKLWALGELAPYTRDGARSAAQSCAEAESSAALAPLAAWQSESERQAAFELPVGLLEAVAQQRAASAPLAVQVEERLLDEPAAGGQSISARGLRRA
jgi:hypothetical protein